VALESTGVYCSHLLRSGERSSLGDRQELQTLLFPEGIKRHPDWGFFEHSNAQLWADLLTAYHEEDPAERAAWTVRIPDGVSLCRLVR